MFNTAQWLFCAKSCDLPLQWFVFTIIKVKIYKYIGPNSGEKIFKTLVNVNLLIIIMCENLWTIIQEIRQPLQKLKT